ncbi:symmetrical bis(5'-nucleosyl)-tetraphosphatase [Chitinibacteraceae bacterium HSL-7]
MARYAIGDVQGCWEELSTLLDKIQFDAGRDQLFLVGDLVNRGPGSLEVLRWAAAAGDSVRVVLGNHDLHLLACYAGIAQPKNGDTLDAVLAAQDVSELCDWLRTRPLLDRIDEGNVMVHAGIWPGWTLSEASRAAAEVQTVLASKNWAAQLREMYGNKPSHPAQAAKPADQLRFVINAFTRMRFVDDENALLLKFKGEIEDAPAGYHPWFSRYNAGSVRVIAGHWSALGLVVRDTLLALDTGCIWGGVMTAVCLDTARVIQVPSRQPAIQFAGK